MMMMMKKNFFNKSKPAITTLFRSLTFRAASQPTPRRPPIPKLPILSRPTTPFSSSLSPSRIGFNLGGGGRRFYYVGRHQIQHFRRRGPHRWFHNPRTVVVVVLAGSTAVLTAYYGNLETVPYTKRTHFVLLSHRLERELGEMEFEKLKAELKGKIVPPTHPESIRVRLISKEIIGALQRGLRQHERVWSDLEYASSSPSEEAAAADPNGLTWRDDGEGKVVRGEERWGSKDELLDDPWVEKSRKSGQTRGLEPATKHLEGLNWEVLVVRNPITNAMCLPGGKIIVFTGLLDHFRSDAEIATVIGHEVGHAVARHSAEGITKNLWLAVLQLILHQFFALPDLINAMSNLLLRLPFSRRMEMEADYIGLVLIASAGYDPRVAPKVYEKLGEISGDTSLQDYLSTHPSSKKRAQLLSQAHVMGEAMTIYSEAISGRGVEGFL